MKKIRSVIISSIGVFLLILILIGIILRYPLNLILDSALLSIIGVSSLGYVLVWSLQKDRIVICKGHISIYKRIFPTFLQKERTLYPPYMSYFYVHENGASIVMKDGEIIDIENPVDENERKLTDLDGSLRSLKIKQVTLEEHLKRTGRKEKSYLSRI